jgi:hypothetical protein
MVKILFVSVLSLLETIAWGFPALSLENLSHPDLVAVWMMAPTGVRTMGVRIFRLMIS